MTSFSSSLSGELLQCHICLEVLTDPVTTSCGHNFCNVCIEACWETGQLYRCPLCKEGFDSKPELKINVAFQKVSTNERNKANKVQLFTDLIHFIERCQSELLEVMEQKQTAAETQAEEMIKELEQEITELERRNTELEQLSHTEDHLHLLQVYSSVCSPPDVKSWTNININTDLLNTDILDKALTCLKEKCLDSVLDVILDPNTAHPKLILSKDGKQVSHGGSWRDVPNNPERFDSSACVLGKDGFSCGRFYFVVQVGDKTEWDLGMARESIERKGKITVCPEKGFWCIWLRNGGEYVANEYCPVPLSLKDKPQKVGVFVDYEEGLVSFYNVETKALIYSFTGQSFTEKIFPFFSPCNKRGDVNTKPLIIHTA
uniref:E3 ubiquitin-protein ligase TRIM39-like n=1 Tax=Sinocyclocheilus anshuiensis TaxID=1608454 RepID=A0A671M9U8_9TELE